MTILQLYQRICCRLKAGDIEEYESEALVLLGHFLNLSRSDIFIRGKQVVEPSVLVIVENTVKERISSRCPVAYIIGAQYFWSSSFDVSPHVLIPRSETEILIEKVLETFVQEGSSNKLKFLDLGTGSGIIAVTLALEMADAVGVAIDRSWAALLVARRNARRLGVAERIAFLNGDWFGAVRPMKDFDLVVANPPYVAHDVLSDLQPELAHEPVLALDGGKYGMEEISRIASGLHEVLRPSGWLFMEIGFDQESYVLDLFNSLGLYGQVLVHRDYAGLPRILQAQMLY